ncbi:MAG: FkbM family methyltransferase [Acidobacteriia bacterium]|nr:FkbM family methyltransferase [Terriglobia bacterium]
MKLEPSPRFAQRAVSDGILDSLTVVDVGASGGIGAQWRVLGDRLHAVGFDPLVQEVERLNACETNRNVSYVAALVGLKNPQRSDRPDTRRNNQPWFRTSTVRARTILGRTFAETHYDQTGANELTHDKIELNDYFAGQTVDFIKTDTDGFDVEVVMGAGTLLAQSPVLGLQVEVSLQGVQEDDSANTFRNMDRLLQQAGFSFFDMELYRYTRAALPGKFRCPFATDTKEGQALGADLLYLRDISLPDYEQVWGCRIEPQHVVRLACICETYGFADCAADFLVAYRDRLPFDVEPYLDALTPEFEGRQLSYREYNELFNRDVSAFYSKEA